MEQGQAAEVPAGNGETDWEDVAAESAASLKDAEAIRAQCVEKRRYSTARTVPLDFEELAGIGQRMAGKLVDIEGLEDEKKELSSQIKALRDGVRDLRSELASGKGERRFDVIEYHDEERCHVYLVHAETEAVIEDRTMTAFERQGELSYQAGAEDEADDLDDEDEQPDDGDGDDAPASDDGNDGAPADDIEF